MPGLSGDRHDGLPCVAIDLWAQRRDWCSSPRWTTPPAGEACFIATVSPPASAWRCAAGKLPAAHARGFAVISRRRASRRGASSVVDHHVDVVALPVRSRRLHGAADAAGGLQQRAIWFSASSSSSRP